MPEGLFRLIFVPDTFREAVSGRSCLRALDLYRKEVRT
jgi:hypothetical protein